MPKIEIYHSGGKSLKTNANLGDTLLQAISDAGVYLDAPCGGGGRCGKCLVRLEPNGEEVLACMTYVDGDTQVRLPDEGEMKIADSLEDPDSYPARHPGLNPQSPESSANKESLQIGIAIDVGTTTVVASLIDCDTGRTIATASGVNAQRIYGADVISRIDYSAKNGHEKLTKLIRAQIETLIKQAFLDTSAYTEKVTRGLTRNPLNHRETKGDCGSQAAMTGVFKESQIKHIVIAGNTIMQHLVAGLSPISMGTAPFTPISLFGTESPAWEGMSVANDAKIYYMPAISAYVGGDITAGVFAVEGNSNFWHTVPEVECRANSNFCYNVSEVDGQANPNFWSSRPEVRSSEKTLLFLDIGTNGEMVLRHEDKYYCCATAAGPAFEGAQIEMGMAATSGAISRAMWDEAENRLKLTVIGETTPIGICGSGLLDALAYLVENGKKTELSDTEAPLPYVDETGRLVNDTSSPDRFYLTNNVYITSQDIRKLQLAKAAIAAGIQTLINYAGITEKQIATLILAGGFGNYLDKASAAKIGLIPQSLLSVTKSMGNTALSGAVQMLCNEEARLKLKSISERMEYIELSTSKIFNEEFIEQMMF